MSDLVPPDKIEQIVGARRHRTAHIVRAVSSEQTVYILHSQECLDDCLIRGVDLRGCRFSLALDHGIEPERWAGCEDRPFAAGVWQDRLIPLEGTDRTLAEKGQLL